MPRSHVPKHQLIVPSTLLALATNIPTYKDTKPQRYIRSHHWHMSYLKQKQSKRISRQWMNERTYIVCFTKPIHLVCKLRRKTYVFLSRFPCYFEANGQNHIHFWLIQVLKNSMTWYFLTFRSLSSKLEVVYPPWPCGVEEKMLIFSSIQSRS